MQEDRPLPQPTPQQDILDLGEAVLCAFTSPRPSSTAPAWSHPVRWTLLSPHVRGSAREAGRSEKGLDQLPDIITLVLIFVYCSIASRPYSAPIPLALWPLTGVPGDNVWTQLIQITPAFRRRL